MNKAKVLSTVVVFSLLALVARPAQAMLRGSERAEFQLALDQCHSALTALYDDSGEHRIHLRPAVQMADGMVTFWINSTRDSKGERVELKARCISDLDGGLHSLRVAQGHWH